MNELTINDIQQAQILIIINLDTTRYKIIALVHGKGLLSCIINEIIKQGVERNLVNNFNWEYQPKSRKWVNKHNKNIYGDGSIMPM